jgi:hypothetical protein
VDPAGRTTLAKHRAFPPTLVLDGKQLRKISATTVTVAEVVRSIVVVVEVEITSVGETDVVMPVAVMVGETVVKVVVVVMVGLYVVLVKVKMVVLVTVVVSIVSVVVTVPCKVGVADNAAADA